MSSFTGKKAGDDFIRFYNLISVESDRGAVLVSAALLDEGLQNLIQAKLISSTKEKDPLFHGAIAPLGTFSSRIEMALRLGLIDESLNSILNTFRRLRNDFAHSYEPVKLEDQTPKNRITAILNEYDDIRDKLDKTCLKSITKVLAEKGHSDEDPKKFYEDRWSTRATFDIFFAMTAVVIHNIASEVTQLKPREKRTSGS